MTHSKDGQIEMLGSGRRGRKSERVERRRKVCRSTKRGMGPEGGRRFTVSGSEVACEGSEWKSGRIGSIVVIRFICL